MNPLRILILAGVASLLSLQFTFADLPVNTGKANDEQVQNALKAEAAGAVADRDKMLQKVLGSDPAFKEANWQSGKLEYEGRWIHFKDLQDAGADEATLAEYRAARDKALITYQAQLDLANWCRSHRLFDRERAHLIAALELCNTVNNSNEAAVRSRLGLRLVDGAWMSEDEIRAEKRNQAAVRKSLKSWQPVVQRLSDKLDNRNENARAQARLELEKLDDPIVLPALEAVMSEAGLEKSRLLVELVARFKSVKAAEPLARLAVLSEWNIVRKEAAAKLRERPVGAYAPELLASMRTPIDSNINLFIGADGVHVTELLSSETQTANQHLERVFSHFVKQASVVERVQSRAGRDETNGTRRERALAAAEIRGSQEVLAAELEVAQRNNEIDQWNNRVCVVLADATGLNLPAEPEPWWEWWRDYNQLAQTSKRQEYEQSYTADTTYVSEIVPQIECLVAGTPVWTDRGLATVETIKVGDLVLSKHPETGELSYKPVLRTTVRDPEPVFKVTTDHGEIRATGGHNFWVSGRGWIRLRDVKPKERFHGATAPATVQALTEDGKEKTYNLVVADFHTYFVGADLVLSHDLTFAKPVDATVPGMKVAASR